MVTKEKREEIRTRFSNLTSSPRFKSLSPEEQSAHRQTFFNMLRDEGISGEDIADIVSPRPATSRVLPGISDVLAGTQNLLGQFGAGAREGLTLGYSPSSVPPPRGIGERIAKFGGEVAGITPAFTAATLGAGAGAGALAGRAGIKVAPKVASLIAQALGGAAVGAAEKSESAAERALKTGAFAAVPFALKGAATGARKAFPRRLPGKKVPTAVAKAMKRVPGQEFSSEVPRSLRKIPTNIIQRLQERIARQGEFTTFRALVNEGMSERQAKQLIRRAKGTGKVEAAPLAKPESPTGIPETLNESADLIANVARRLVNETEDEVVTYLRGVGIPKGRALSVIRDIRRLMPAGGGTGLPKAPPGGGAVPPPPSKAPVARVKQPASGPGSAPAPPPLDVAPTQFQNSPERILESRDIDILFTKALERVRPQIRAQARKGKMSIEQVEELAKGVGLTYEEIVAFRPGTILNVEELAAANSVMNTRKAIALNAHVEAIKKGTPESLAAASATMDEFVAAAGHVSPVKSELGRALGFLKHAKGRKTPYDEALERISKPLDKKVLEETVKGFLAIDPNDTRALIAFARGAQKATKPQMVFEAWMNGLLSGPPTQIANITGNSLAMLLRPVEDFSSASIDASLSLMTGAERSRFFRESVFDMVGLVRGFPEAGKAFLDVLSTGTPRGLTKFDTGFGLSAIPGSKGAFIRIPGRTLHSVDAAFKVVNGSMEAHKLAIRQAIQDDIAAKKTGKAIDVYKRMADYIVNPTDDMREAIARDMNYRTFTNRLSGPIGRNLLRLRDAIPGAQYVVPFVTTPVNLINYSLGRTPLKMPLRVVQFAKGVIDKGAFIDDAGKALTGTAIASIFYFAALEGKITGSGPRDPAKRAAWFAAGFKPFSIMVNGKAYSYERFEPLSTIVNIAALIAESRMYGIEKDNDNKIAELVLVAHIVNSMTDKTFTRGLKDLTEAFSLPEAKFTRWYRNLAASAVPSFSAVAARAVDPVVRDPQSILETIMTRIPVVSKAVPAKQDVAGAEIKRGGNVATRFALPLAIGQASDSPGLQELFRLNMGLGKSSKGDFTDEEFAKLLSESGGDLVKRLNALSRTRQFIAKSDDERYRSMKSIIRASRKLSSGEFRKSLSRKRQLELLKEKLSVPEPLFPRPRR